MNRYERALYIDLIIARVIAWAFWLTLFVYEFIVAISPEVSLNWLAVAILMLGASWSSETERQQEEKLKALVTR